MYQCEEERRNQQSKAEIGPQEMNRSSKGRVDPRLNISSKENFLSKSSTKEQPENREEDVPQGPPGTPRNDQRNGQQNEENQQADPRRRSAQEVSFFLQHQQEQQGEHEATASGQESKRGRWAAPGIHFE